MLFRKYRINRSTYWAGFGFLVAWVLFAIFVLHKEKGYVSEVVIALICIPRLHDIGRSGWIVAGGLLAYFVVVFGIVLNLDLDTALIVLGIVNIGLTGLLIYLGTIPGDTAANAYGDPPAPGIQFRRNGTIAKSREG